MFRDFLARIKEESIHPTLSTMCKIKNQCVDFTVDAYANGRRSLDDQLQCLQSLVTLFLNAGESACGLDFEFNVLVSAIVLSVVYQYLIRYVHRGGTKTYNSGSLEFRATYVSIVLFRGAYVWIKFRDVASRKVSRRHRKDEFGNRVPVGKWLPKFKPPREKDVATGPSASFQCLELGGYTTERDAEVVWQIAAFYYEKDEGLVELEDGFCFNIPPMNEQERHRRGEVKWKWVTNKVKEVFKDFKATRELWKEFLRIVSGDVELPTEQGVVNVNDLHDHTLPQLVLDVGDFLTATPTEIQGTQTGSGAADYDFQLPENLQSPDIQNHQEGSNAQLASIPDSVGSGSDAIGDNQQSLLAIPTSIFVRREEVLATGGTEKEDLVGVINKVGEGQDRLREIQSFLFEDDEIQTEQGASTVNVHLQHDLENLQLQFYCLVNQVHDPACDASLHSHIVPQPLSGVGDIPESFREQDTITTQEEERAEEAANTLWQANIH